MLQLMYQRKLSFSNYLIGYLHNKQMFRYAKIHNTDTEIITKGVSEFEKRKKN